MTREPEVVSAEQYLALGAKGKRRKRSKYGAEPIVIDGIRFDSTAEGARYRELCFLRDAGEIADLQLQPRFPLHVNGRKIGDYLADFRYRDADGTEHAEDVKGVRTDVYKWKKRHVEAEYGIEIEEIT